MPSQLINDRPLIFSAAANDRAPYVFIILTLTQIGPEHFPPDQDMVDFGERSGQASPKKSEEGRKAGAEGARRGGRRCGGGGRRLGLAAVRGLRGRIPQAGRIHPYRIYLLWSTGWEHQQESPTYDIILLMQYRASDKKLGYWPTLDFLFLETAYSTLTAV